MKAMNFKEIPQPQRQRQGPVPPAEKHAEQPPASRTIRDTRSVGDILRTEAETLRELGFPVDNKARIDPMAFGEVYSESAIAHDRHLVDRKKLEFDRDPDRERVGRVLEETLALAFNKFWFDKQLIKVRTAEYDDFLYGVDELIINPKTRRIIAAVDATTAPDLKAPKLKENVNGRFSVKYGVELGRNGEVKKGPLSNIPYLVISMDPVDLLMMFQSITGMETYSPEAIKRVGENLLKKLVQEAKVFEELADVEHKSMYRDLRADLEEVRTNSNLAQAK